MLKIQQMIPKPILLGMFRTLAMCLAFVPIGVSADVVSADIVINPGDIGETFLYKSFDVTSELLDGNGIVIDSDGSTLNVDIVFSEMKRIEVLGVGTGLVISLVTTWEGPISFFDVPLTPGVMALSDENGGFLVSASVYANEYLFDSVEYSGFIDNDDLPSNPLIFHDIHFLIELPTSVDAGFLVGAELAISGSGGSSPAGSFFPEYTVVPEPCTFAGALISLTSIGYVRRRRKQVA